MSEHTFPQPICEQIWNQKYRFQTERKGFKSDNSPVDTWNRIATACADVPRLHNNGEERDALAKRFKNALEGFKFLPAGRIQSGAGTARKVTLFNCFVMGTVPDSLSGIFDMLKEAALTMQQGGGIGYDFSTIRPKGTIVKSVESDASGPLSFMDVWDSMCKTIMSAGSRRGAMMATMRCDHPDIMDFITAKQDPARLRNFNVSVLVTDAFMEAVAKVKANGGLCEHGEGWDLKFNGEVYSEVNPLELWNAILQNTYDFAEPGVIFIDRINKENNLWFCETIAATNPCGEQPLPPYGACLLGSVNLPMFIKDPFTSGVSFDLKLLEETVRTSVRMLDSVIDTSGFPLPQQEQEAQHKRRMGLGITGLADMLFMMGHRYGAPSAVNLTDELMRYIAIYAYEESIQMAIEMGPAPVLETKEARLKFVQSGFMQRMPSEIRDKVIVHGLRNALLLSIAPTGTISMYAGNVSSGGEPIFAPFYDRKVTRQNGVKETERVSVYSVHKFFELGYTQDDQWWKDYMTTAQDLAPEDHIVMQAVCQRWVDSSISKTVNCPEDITFEEFKAVYQDAYDSGCKGCTTYRPNDVTGSVLSVPTEDVPTEDEVPVKEPNKEEEVPASVMGNHQIIDRPSAVDGTTYKLRWMGEAVYVVFNQIESGDGFAPFEMFVVSKNLAHQAWTSALTRMVSAIFRRGGDVRFVVEELKSVYDPKGGSYIEGKYVPSLVALLGQTLEQHLDVIGYHPTHDTNKEIVKEEVITLTEQLPDQHVPDQCPTCGEFSMIPVSGCPTCQSCGYSKCG